MLTEKDALAVEEFQNFLSRTALLGHANSSDVIFDADLSVVCPNFNDRKWVGIKNGKLVLL